ncbi:uncharacterized protein LOC113320255 [Papaver somniferum]|uniref:uncharacterized protein LOC113320255 n=1 Tax=Papaver somniferum TaxID=3469 RepID=UPI000E6FB797|nr:uncharacterized protein LOC113320255 [Papaver somniferum]
MSRVVRFNKAHKGVMVNYSGRCVTALVFKLGNPMMLLRNSSIAFMWVLGVEISAIYKLWRKRLQGSVIWSRLILQVICIQESCAAREPFDRLSLSIRFNFSGSPILQLRGGSEKSLMVCVAANKYGGESQILSRRFTCNFVFISLSASKSCHESLPQGIKFCLLNLVLWSIACSDVFTWFSTALPEEPRSTVCSRNECCSGLEEFLVVKIEVMLVLVNGDVCSYGYLRWKSRLFLPGLWSVQKFTYQFSALTKN